MITPQNRKDKQQDDLCEELLRERAAVLSRAGTAVSDAIDRLMRMDREIEKKIFFLKALNRNKNKREILQEKKLICEEINLSINQFNATRQKAHLQYYYLIVTREALGLRRHEMVQEIYRIPAEKKKL
ncbi:MAG: hypothetical protein ABSF79_01360 [Smithellaceae bacterium]|jgi:hypothetical protein